MATIIKPEIRIWFSLSAKMCIFFIGNRNVAQLCHRQQKRQELPLIREQWATFEKGDVFLGDKGFCSYFDRVQLINRGVDTVVTRARRKPVGKKNCNQELDPDNL